MTIELMRQLLDVERNIGKANEIINDNLIVLCRILEQETKEQKQTSGFLPMNEEPPRYTRPEGIFEDFEGGTKQ